MAFMAGVSGVRYKFCTFTNMKQDVLCVARFRKFIDYLRLAEGSSEVTVRTRRKVTMYRSMFSLSVWCEVQGTEDC